MENDLLNGLMHISVNGLKANSSEAEKMIEKACLKFQQTRRNKRPYVFVVRTTVKVASIQTVEVKDEAQVELEEAVEKSSEKESDEQFLIKILTTILAVIKTIQAVKQMRTRGLK